MNELLLDFKEVGNRDFETIKGRILSLFRDSPGDVRYVEVTFREGGASGPSVKNRERATSEDANDFAGIIAQSIVEYATKGKDGLAYSSAKVVIPDRR